jgi:hypothetical protein
MLTYPAVTAFGVFNSALTTVAGVIDPVLQFNEAIK